MSAHTPGPWSRNIKPARKYPTVWAGRNTHIAAVVPGAPWGSGNGQTMSDDELEANIALIAAAPDMLVALEEAASRLRYSGDHFHDIGAQARAEADWAASEAAFAIIAKATCTHHPTTGEGQDKTQHASTSPGPVNCSIRKRFQNEVTPRTCERCRLGPCPFFHEDGAKKS